MYIKYINGVEVLTIYKINKKRNCQRLSVSWCKGSMVLMDCINCVTAHWAKKKNHEWKLLSHEQQITWKNGKIIWNFQRGVKKFLTIYALNKVTVITEFRIPNVNSIYNTILVFNIMISKIDLNCKGYIQEFRYNVHA